MEKGNMKLMLKFFKKHTLLLLTAITLIGGFEAGTQTRKIDSLKQFTKVSSARR